MIWTAITYSRANEKIECDVYEASIDPQEAHEEISKKTPNLIISLAKGNHKTGTHIPDLDITITRAKYNRQ